MKELYKCQDCGQKYNIDYETNYMDAPYYYGRVCSKICLSCHLMVGPNEDYEEEGRVHSL